ncbi:Ig-like domain-containing protein [Brevibacillus borstelensis]|uniref:Ig-like domain-containing protein n=1 Tax=Brevibacillus borstelensis TaxID=45462 RepID=UPI0030C3EC6E
MIDPFPDCTISNDTTIPYFDRFRDPDGDSLTYTATSSDKNILAVSVSPGAIHMEKVSPGVVTVTVIANDGKGGTASDSFTVTVK